MGNGKEARRKINFWIGVIGTIGVVGKVAPFGRKFWQGLRRSAGMNNMNLNRRYLSNISPCICSTPLYLPSAGVSPQGDTRGIVRSVTWLINLLTSMYSCPTQGAESHYPSAIGEHPIKKERTEGPFFYYADYKSLKWNDFLPLA